MFWVQLLIFIISMKYSQRDLGELCDSQFDIKKIKLIFLKEKMLSRGAHGLLDFVFHVPLVALV